MARNDSPDIGQQVEAWYREFFCDRQHPMVTEVQNEIREAVDELKRRLTAI